MRTRLHNNNMSRGKRMSDESDDNDEVKFTDSNRRTKEGTSSPTAEGAENSKELVSNHVTGQLDILTEFINDHIRVYRMIPWIVGSVGIALFLRYSHIPLRRFRQVSDIPADFITKNRCISGVVKGANWNTVEVWHIPMWRWALRWGTQLPEKCSHKELLDVEFSGVIIGNPYHATGWLRKRLLGRRVWLTLLNRSLSKDQEAVQCIVRYGKKGIFWWQQRACVNEELLTSGVGSLGDVTGFKNNADYAQFVSRLIQSEKEAKEKGSGIWHGTEHVTMWNRLKNYFKHQ